MARFKNQNMNLLPMKHRREIALWLETSQLGGGKISVHCGACKTEIIPSIKKSYWNYWWTVRERAHENSEDHRAAMVLVKLAGDGNEDW